MKHKIDGRATLALIIAVIASSMVPIFLKYFSAYIDGWTCNGFRYPIATLLYIPWLIKMVRQDRLPSKVWRLALVPAFINMLMQVSWVWAPYYIGAGLMGFLVRMSTIWSVIGSFLLFHDERGLIRSKRFWIGLSLAILGFCSLILFGKEDLSGSTLFGIILAVFASLGWAGYQLAVRKNLSRFDSRTSFGVVAVYTSISMVTMMMMLGEPHEAVALPPMRGAFLILSGFIGISLAHLMFYYAIKRLGVAICNSTNLTGAFLTALLSIVIFGETISQMQWMSGALLILGGILLVRSQVYLHKKK